MFVDGKGEELLELKEGYFVVCLIEGLLNLVGIGSEEVWYLKDARSKSWEVIEFSATTSSRMKHVWEEGDWKTFITNDNLGRRKLLTGNVEDEHPEE